MTSTAHSFDIEDGYCHAHRAQCSMSAPAPIAVCEYPGCTNTERTHTLYRVPVTGELVCDRHNAEDD
jgi:hypothetical protein